MAYGAQVLTNAGMVNLVTGISFREVHRSQIALPSTGVGGGTLSLPLHNYSDLSGTVYFSGAITYNFTPPENFIPRVQIHSDDVVRNSNNIPASIRVRYAASYQNPGDTATINIIALCVGQ